MQKTGTQPLQFLSIFRWNRLGQWTLLLLVALGLGFTLRWVFSFGFFADDWGELENTGSSYSWIFSQFSPLSSNWRVVYYVWWKMMFNQFGMNPFPFYVAHFIQHIVCSVWVYFLARHLTQSLRVGVMAGLLFAFHKSTAMNITYNCAIIDCFVVFFGVPALLFYFRAVEARGRLQKAVWFVFCYVFFLFTLNSKLMGITFPVLLLLYELFLSKKGKLLDSVRRQWPIWAMYGAFTLAIARELQKTTPSYGTDYSWLGYWKGISWYFASAMLQGFSIPGSQVVWLPLIPLGLGVLLLMLCFWRQRVMWFGVFWFLISLFPVAILKTHHFEHHLYYPMVGACLFAGVVLDQVCRWFLERGRGGRYACLLILLAFSTGFFVRNLPLYRYEEIEAVTAAAKNQRTLHDLKALYPVMPANAHLYFNFSPVASLVDSGASIRILWKDKTLKVSVIPDEKDFAAAIRGEIETPDHDRFKTVTEKLLVFSYHPETGAVDDVTATYLKQPKKE